jgi:antitoxin ParD1/3/4
MLECTLKDKGSTKMPIPITFTVPPALRQWLDQQIAAHGSGEEQFLRDLLRKEQRRQAREQIEDALKEGLNSGTARPLRDATWNRIKTRAEGLGRKKSR